MYKMPFEIGDKFVYTGNINKKRIGQKGEILSAHWDNNCRAYNCRVRFDKGSSGIEYVFDTNIVLINRYLVDL
jgi:hypothetical protein